MENWKTKKIALKSVSLTAINGDVYGFKLKRNLTTPECKHIVKMLGLCNYQRDAFFDGDSYDDYLHDMTKAVNDWLKGEEDFYYLKLLHREDGDLDDKVEFRIIPILNYLQKKEII